LANGQNWTSGYASPVRLVFLCTWLGCLLQIGCGGATKARPDGSVGGDGGAAPSPVASCDCVPVSLSWWREGGAVMSSTSSSVTSCNQYKFDEHAKPPALHCASTLDGCGERLGIDDLNAALAHPDVVAALAASPVVYGSDPRPIDGQVDHIEIGDRVIEVGNDCGDTPDCSLPDGIVALDQLLGHLELQEQTRRVCKD
jgi:hypothetical protein